MKRLFYEEWQQKRLNKIINIFGEDWFAGKKVLELGSCYGDIGIPLLKLGAHVTFTDLRENYLEAIKEKVIDLNGNLAPCEFKQLNQENIYNLNQQYDLVLHLGVLYHIKNWKQDLKCAISHGKYCILESIVAAKPDINGDTELVPTKNFDEYSGDGGNRSLFSAESVESQLAIAGNKYIRFDTRDLNTNISWNSEGYIQMLYDWKFPTAIHYRNNMVLNNQSVNVCFRRFWFVMR